MESKYVGVADTAKILRKALKDAFPSVKFGVRSKKYAGGASIYISWVDGPTTRQVDAIARQFQSSRFDGSIDYGYSVTHWLLPDGTTRIAHNPGSACTMGYDPGEKNEKPHPDAILVHLGSSYISTSRSYSVGMVRRALDKLERKWGGFSSKDIEINVGYSGSAWPNAVGSIRVENAGPEYLDILLYSELSRRSSVPMESKGAA
jgi:hypothetical protein